MPNPGEVLGELELYIPMCNTCGGALRDTPTIDYKIALGACIAHRDQDKKTSHAVGVVAAAAPIVIPKKPALPPQATVTPYMNALELLADAVRHYRTTVSENVGGANKENALAAFTLMIDRLAVVDFAKAAHA